MEDVAMKEVVDMIMGEEIQAGVYIKQEFGPRWANNFYFDFWGSLIQFSINQVYYYSGDCLVIDLYYRENPLRVDIGVCNKHQYPLSMDPSYNINLASDCLTIILQ